MAEWFAPIANISQFKNLAGMHKCSVSYNSTNSPKWEVVFLWNNAETDKNRRVADLRHEEFFASNNANSQVCFWHLRTKTVCTHSHSTTTNPPWNRSNEGTMYQTECRKHYTLLNCTCICNLRPLKNSKQSQFSFCEGAGWIYKSDPTKSIVDKKIGTLWSHSPQFMNKMGVCPRESWTTFFTKKEIHV